MNCKNCRWWDGDSNAEEARCMRYGNYGFESVVEPLRIRVPGDESSYLYAKAMFGCVQFEDKRQ